AGGQQIDIWVCGAGFSRKPLPAVAAQHVAACNQWHLLLSRDRRERSWAEARSTKPMQARPYLVAALISCLALVVVSGQNQETPPAKTKKSSKGKKKSTSKSTGKKSGSKSSAKAKKKAGPRGQVHPTPERYKQIEEALVARGYLLEEPTGKWGPNAVEALRSFQADHDLPPPGRLASLSLLPLGL